MCSKYNICGFLSGNSSILESKFNDENYNDMFNKVINQNIYKLYFDYNSIAFITDCEVGGNMICAETIMNIRRKARLEIYLYNILPFKNREKYLTKTYKNRYKILREKCNITTYVGDEYTKKCFSQKDKLIIEHSNILFCIYSLKNKSKIRNLLDIALIKRKRLILLDIETLNVINFY